MAVRGTEMKFRILRYSQDRLTPESNSRVFRPALDRVCLGSVFWACFSMRGFMLGFYEEMADLAAMSEDDGFLGQCASSEMENSTPDDQNLLSTLPAVALLPRAPRQLKLSTTLPGNDSNA